MAYLLGNILGRLIGSIFLVWLVLFVVNKFDFAKANSNFKSPLSLIAVLVLFAVGMFSVNLS